MSEFELKKINKIKEKIVYFEIAITSLNKLEEIKKSGDYLIFEKDTDEEEHVNIEQLFDQEYHAKKKQVDQLIYELSTLTTLYRFPEAKAVKIVEIKLEEE